jgi:hypothetical protein
VELIFIHRVLNFKKFKTFLNIHLNRIASLSTEKQGGG